MKIENENKIEFNVYDFNTGLGSYHLQLVLYQLTSYSLFKPRA